MSLCIGCTRFESYRRNTLAWKGQNRQNNFVQALVCSFFTPTASSKATVNEKITGSKSKREKEYQSMIHGTARKSSGIKPAILEYLHFNFGFMLENVEYFSYFNIKLQQEITCILITMFNLT